MINVILFPPKASYAEVKQFLFICVLAEFVKLNIVSLAYRCEGNWCSKPFKPCRAQSKSILETVLYDLKGHFTFKLKKCSLQTARLNLLVSHKFSVTVALGELAL